MRSSRFVGLQITVQGEGAPKPLTRFEEASAFPSLIQSELARAGFSQPTPIQAQVRPCLLWMGLPCASCLLAPCSSAQCCILFPQTWPIALQGRDLIGLAETGSGKTLAYLLPGIVHIKAQPPIQPGLDGPIVLALAPTRELAVQIQAECVRFGSPSRVRSTCVYGGVPKQEQVRSSESRTHAWSSCLPLQPGSAKRELGMR